MIGLVFLIIICIVIRLLIIGVVVDVKKRLLMVGVFIVGVVF